LDGKQHLQLGDRIGSDGLQKMLGNAGFDTTSKKNRNKRKKGEEEDDEKKNVKKARV